MGRPPKLTDELSAKIVGHYQGGDTDLQVAKKVGVSVRSIQYWKRRHPWFLHALKEAKSGPDDAVEIALLQRALGYEVDEEVVFCSFGRIITHKKKKHFSPDVVAQIFWLKNRRPDRWRESKIDAPPPALIGPPPGKKTFAEFCITSGYPIPYPQQIGMRDFILDAVKLNEPHLLLGSRGYGKTDYVTILTLAYEIYLDGTFTSLVVTKSRTRNASILNEIAMALEKNGMKLEKRNTQEVRVDGLVGKDSSASATTLASLSLRGRHPKIVIMDDPVTPDDVSEAARARAKRTYEEIMKLTQAVGVIGQPVHQYDLFEELRPMIKRLELPFGSIPELDPDLSAMKAAGVSEASISASYRLKVLSEGTTPFDNIRYVDEFPVGDSVAWIDPSHKGKDYTALAIVRAYMDGVAVVGFTYRKAWNHCVEEMLAQMNRFGVRRLAIETNGLGTQPVEMLQSLLAGRVGVVGRDSSVNKHAKIMAAGAYAHLIHLSKQSDRIFRDLTVKYEYGAANDDPPDAIASCLEWIGLIRGK